MPLDDLYGWLIILVSFTASIFIFDLWWRFFYRLHNPSEMSGFDYCLFYLTCALFTWGIAGLLLKYISKNNLEGSDFVRYVVSVVNSGFFLFAATYLHYSPKWLTDNKRAVQAKIVMLSLFILVCNIVLGVLTNKSIFSQFPDFLLSVFTASILSVAFSRAFWNSGLKIISILSGCIIFLLLLSQPFCFIYISEAIPPEYVFLFLLYIKIAFILLICFIAYSWAHTKYVKASEELNALKAKYKIERENTWKDVAAKVAHKLGNPINAIDLFLQSALEEIGAKNIKESRTILNDMKTPVADAKSVLAEFKSLTKISQLRLNSCNIIKIIEESCKPAKENGVKVEVILRDDIPLLIADKVKIKECFDELIANSLHWLNRNEKKISIICSIVTATDIPVENNNLLIELNSSFKYLKVIYKDTGDGIKLENKTKIFIPYFTTYEHGTGNGMTIVKNYIELHQGFIFENGNFGEGAVFNIYLPIK